MEERTFGKMNVGTKWDAYKDKPVNVTFNGNTYVGVVNNIDPLQNFVYLQPCALINPTATELSIVDKPIMVPYEGVIVVPTKQDTLGEFVQNWNDEKTRERKEKK